MACCSAKTATFLVDFGSILGAATAALSPTVNYVYKRGFQAFGWSVVGCIRPQQQLQQNSIYMASSVSFSLVLSNTSTRQQNAFLR